VLLGHFAVAAASKRVAPKAPLWTLFLAAEWADVVWPVLVLTGVERVRIDPGNTAVTPLAFVSYPFTHSLAMDLGWGVLLGLAAYWLLRDRRAAWVVGALVVSHWVLDWISHAPDMPIWPGGPRYGLGLWNSVAATVIIELGMWAAGLALYATATRPRTRAGTWSLWSLVGLLTAIYAMNLMGPPPPSVRAVAWAGVLLWLVFPWAWWIDRTRALRTR
jgi:hypothetical protein